MSNIFALDNIDPDDMAEHINIDELYEKKRTQDLKKLETFRKQLAQVHKKIKIASKQKTNNTSCFFAVPEHIIGVSNFDNPGCIAYLMDSLEKNKFRVRYYHPNAIYISWDHWMPSYVRAEIKKKYGITVDEFGQQVFEEEEEEEQEQTQQKQGTTTAKAKKTYTPLETYRQMANLPAKPNLAEYYMG